MGAAIKRKLPVKCRYKFSGRPPCAQHVPQSLTEIRRQTASSASSFPCPDIGPVFQAGVPDPFTAGATAVLHRCASAWLFVSAAVGISLSSGPKAEEMSLWASVSLAVGWREGQLLEVIPSPEALPYAPYVLGFYLMLLVHLWVWTVKSCHFVVKVIILMPTACPPSCSLSECVHGLPCSPSACSSCCVPLASQLWWQHLGLGLRLLLEAPYCCLNCTTVRNSEYLLTPEQGVGKCQIPLRDSRSYFFLIHSHYPVFVTKCMAAEL